MVNQSKNKAGKALKELVVDGIGFHCLKVLLKQVPHRNVYSEALFR
jgi:hypothetical protein